MPITKQDVELAGKLAKMHISPEESDMYEAQLKELFNWVQELSAINTDNVKLTNVNQAAHIRPDVPTCNENLAAQLRVEFANQAQDCAKVKKVL